MNTYLVRYRINSTQTNTEAKTSAPSGLVAYCKVALYAALHYDQDISPISVELVDGLEFNQLVEQARHYNPEIRL